MIGLLFVLALLPQDSPVVTAPEALDDPAAELSDPMLAPIEGYVVTEPATMTLAPVTEGVEPEARPEIASTEAPLPPQPAPTPPPPVSPPPQPQPARVSATLPAPYRATPTEAPSPARPFAYPRTPPASYPRPSPGPSTPQPYAYPSTSAPRIIPGFGGGRTIDQPTGYGFPTAEEAAYESRVRGSAMSAQVGRGPLDGGWIVTGDDGTELFAFQFIDEGYGTLDGAWRSAAAVGRSGFFASAARSGASLTLRFTERPGQPFSTLRLSSPDGRAWSGEFERAGDTRRVTMRPS